MTTISCEKCGRMYEVKRPELIPHYCENCDRKEAERLKKLHPPMHQRSEQQKKMEPF
jgi:hypothetical protein